MSQEQIGIGSSPNDSNGDSIRVAFEKVNNNATDAEGRFTVIERTVAEQREINTASPTAILLTDGFLLFDSTLTAISIDLPSASIGRVKIPFKDAGTNSESKSIQFLAVGLDKIVDTLPDQTSTLISSNGFTGAFLSNGVDTWYLI